MNKRYIKPKTESIVTTPESLLAAFSGVEFTDENGNPVPGTPGMTTGSGDLDPGESFAKPKNLWDFEDAENQ